MYEIERTDASHRSRDSISGMGSALRLRRSEPEVSDTYSLNSLGSHTGYTAPGSATS